VIIEPRRRPGNRPAITSPAALPPASVFFGSTVRGLLVPDAELLEETFEEEALVVVAELEDVAELNEVVEVDEGAALLVPVCACFVSAFLRHESPPFTHS
jgi:hypothetical protein